MFLKKKPLSQPTAVKTPVINHKGGKRGISIIGEGCSFDGKVFLQGEARVGGKVKGHIVADGFLTLEQSSFVQGEIVGQQIQISGRVEGNVTCEDILVVTQTAQVIGELKAMRIVVEDGAKIDGRVHSHDKSAKEKMSSKVLAPSVAVAG